MSNLKDGEAYDSLYHAADCRAKADWLVGMNASRALALASGMPNNSLGRVQTPTLAMICSRYKENRDFVSTPYWQLHITLERLGEFRQFAHIEDFKSKEQAEAAHTILARLNGTHHKGGAQAYLPTGTVTLRPYHLAEGLQYASRYECGEDSFCGTGSL